MAVNDFSNWQLEVERLIHTLEGGRSTLEQRQAAKDALRQLAEFLDRCPIGRSEEVDIARTFFGLPDNDGSALPCHWAAEDIPL